MTINLRWKTDKPTTAISRTLIAVKLRLPSAIAEAFTVTASDGTNSIPVIVRSAIGNELALLLKPTADSGSHPDIAVTYTPA